MDLEVALPLGEPPHFVALHVEPQLGGREQRKQRLMVGEHADLAHLGARRDHLDVSREHLALGSEHLDRERGVGHQALTPPSPPRQPGRSSPS